MQHYVYFRSHDFKDEFNHKMAIEMIPYASWYPWLIEVGNKWRLSDVLRMHEYKFALLLKSLEELHYESQQEVNLWGKRVPFNTVFVLLAIASPWSITYLYVAMYVVCLRNRCWQECSVRSEISAIPSDKVYFHVRSLRALWMWMSSPGLLVRVALTTSGWRVIQKKV